MANILRQLNSPDLGLPADAYIYSLSPCGDDALAVVSSDNSLRCFDRQTLQLLPNGVKASIHTGHKDEVGPTGLCQASDGSHVLATSGRDGAVKVWDIRTGGGPVSTFFTGTWEYDDCSTICISWRGLVLLSILCFLSRAFIWVVCRNCLPSR